ncbi:MAG: xanthine dehydrogenase [Chloroflexi bacterium]|nr:XdhC family protein [Chloroflexi bacterium CFX1]MCK6566861.1 XdhC family protein [Anaerolineales bacterium]MCQ3951849.1 xanthine dehydrogenase [Chloroflexota bacterium]MDL1917787.1 XdhC family protein [Chloroflexi bacterium CFX5]NUQ58748.1 XdhC family protein [Anaerolineales bacterium]
MTSLYKALSELEKNNQPAALCTVVKSEGSTPRHVGSKMLVYPDGKFIGTVGGGDLEHRVLDEAWMAISDGTPRYLHYNMADPSRGDPGVCGGQVEVFVEPILPAPTLVVIGAGHVGKAVVHLAKWLGFHVVVSDDRAEFCTPEATPGADEYLPIEMGKLAESLKITNRTYLAVTSRGSGVDAHGLPPLLESEAAYIGVIGSKRRWATTVKALKEKGVKDELIAKVHSPIGLELQAETPEEIAVSIMAEVLMVRDKGTGRQMRGGKRAVIGNQ